LKSSGIRLAAGEALLRGLNAELVKIERQIE
jgi:hypothetical protein